MSARHWGEAAGAVRFQIPRPPCLGGNVAVNVRKYIKKTGSELLNGKNGEEAAGFRYGTAHWAVGGKLFWKTNLSTLRKVISSSGT